ncbi:hypothetical protein AB0L40_03730 [Patulibacter sp. NPDC049589]|uniref:hypothetical protein n=1 Tax=Patulibacter sp. NPDC049589 TaxID=3154731 RepID=UPI00344AAF98
MRRPSPLAPATPAAGRRTAAAGALLGAVCAVVATVGSAPAGAQTAPVVASCGITFVATDISYATVGQGLDVASGAFTAATSAECAGGAAALKSLLGTGPAAGVKQTVDGWECVVTSDGGRCYLQTPQRYARVDAACEVVGGGDEESGDPDQGAGPADPTACVTIGGGTGGSGSGSGDAGGSGSGSSGLPAGAAATTYVIDRRGIRRVVPEALALPRSVRGTALTWASWGRATTVAAGKVRVPRGGGRGTVTRTGTITLSGRRSCSGGRRVYTRATARAAGRTVRQTRPGCAKLRS